MFQNPERRCSDAIPSRTGSREQPWCRCGGCGLIRVVCGYWSPVRRRQWGGFGEAGSEQRSLGGPVRQRVRREAGSGGRRTVGTAQRLATRFCESTGAICSVGGRFIAWRRRVEKRALEMDARVDAARATGSGGGSSRGCGGRVASKSSVRTAQVGEEWERQVAGACRAEVKRAFWQKGRRVWTWCFHETDLRHTPLHASTPCDRQAARWQGLCLGRSSTALALPIRRARRLLWSACRPHGSASAPGIHSPAGAQRTPCALGTRPAVLLPHPGHLSRRVNRVCGHGCHALNHPYSALAAL